MTMRGALVLLATALLACQLDLGGVGSAEGGHTDGTTTAGSSGTSSTPSTGPTAGSMSGSATTIADSSGDGMDPSTSDSTVGPSDTSTGEPAGSSSSDTGEPSDCTPILVEAVTSLDGSDDGREWVVLYNPCPSSFDLGPLTLAWGEFAYDGALDLSGSIAAGECFVVGGPTTNGGNFDPSYDLVENFEPNLSREPGAIGLFLLEPAEVDAGDVPVDAVIYGNTNAGFLDSTGAMPGPMIPGSVDLESMRRTSLADTWEYTASPTPNDCPGF